MEKLSDSQQWVLLLVCVIGFAVLCGAVAMWLYNATTSAIHRYKTRRRSLRYD
jgi:uncharacterized membrane protein YidH (DUF202 family)